MEFLSFPSMLLMLLTLLWINWRATVCFISLAAASWCEEETFLCSSQVHSCQVFLISRDRSGCWRFHECSMSILFFVVSKEVFFMAETTHSLMLYNSSNRHCCTSVIVLWLPFNFLIFFTTCITYFVIWKLHAHQDWGRFINPLRIDLWVFRTV